MGLHFRAIERDVTHRAKPGASAQLQTAPASMADVPWSPRQEIKSRFACPSIARTDRVKRARPDGWGARGERLRSPRTRPVTTEPVLTTCPKGNALRATRLERLQEGDD